MLSCDHVQDIAASGLRKVFDTHVLCACFFYSSFTRPLTISPWPIRNRTINLQNISGFCDDYLARSFSFMLNII